MTSAKRSASEPTARLAQEVQQAELDALVGDLCSATGAPIVLVDLGGRILAAAGCERRLAELAWPQRDRPLPKVIAHGLETLNDERHPASVALGAGVVVLLQPILSAEHGGAALAAGPIVLMERSAPLSAQKHIADLAEELGAEESAVKARLEAEEAFDEARYSSLVSSLRAMGLALSLICRYDRAVQRRQAELEALYEVGVTLTSTLDLDRVLEEVLERAIEQTGARGGSVMLLDPSRRYLTIAKARGLSDEIVADTMVPMGEGIAGWVAQENKPRVMLKGVRDLLSRSRRPKEQMTSALSVPIRARGHVIGVINVNDCVHADNFDEDDLHILQMLAIPAGIAVENARAHGALKAQVQRSD